MNIPWILLPWINLLIPCFFGIGEGPSSAEKQQAGDIGALANFATSTGEGDISAASNFWKSILSGDPSQIAKVLGPEISSINQQGQQKKKTSSEFNTRGGGTNAGLQMTDDATRSSFDSLISGLTSSSASNLGSIGSGLLSTGLSGHTAAFDASKTIHDQNLAKWNDLFKTIAQTASAFGGPVGDIGTVLS
jgi:hypothetical protein